MDAEAIYRKLEWAKFSQREQIAAEVARDHTPEQIGQLAGGLAHAAQAVRLGVIEILRHARSRDALRTLFDHARSHDGDDRVFALRAIAELAQPGDDFLADTIERWRVGGDAFVQVHAEKIATAIALPRIRPPSPPPAAPVEPPPEGGRTVGQLVVELFAATANAERFRLIAGIEQRGPAATAAATRLVLQKGNADLIAYACRAVIRQAAMLPGGETLLPLLQAARRRIGDAPAAVAAIDDAMIALGAPEAGSLIAGVGDPGKLDTPQLDALVARLVLRPTAEVALQVPRLLELLAARPALWSSLGPVLAYAAGDVRTTTRTELRRLTDLVLVDLRRDRPVPPVTAVSACRVLAEIAEPGEPLLRPLRVALEKLAAVEAADALCRLCARLATEEAAGVLVAMLRDPLEPARTRARAAIAAWKTPSPWRIALGEGDEPAITAHYTGERGQELVRRGGRLVDATSGEDHVLDERGLPVRATRTEYGGCACCAPPRALVRRGTEGLRCPSSWESYLRDTGHSRRESEHAFGRCRHCDSLRPRYKDGVRIICRDCGSWNYEGR